MNNNQRTTRHTAGLEGPEAADLRVPTLSILAHPDAGRVGEMVTLPTLAAGRVVELSRLTPIFGLPGQHPNAALEETHLSRQPLLLLPGPSSGAVTIARADSSTRTQVDGEELRDSFTIDGAGLDRGAVIVLGHRIVLMLHRHHPVPVELPAYGLVGESTAILRVRQEIRRVAGLDVTVLLRGDSGTGKELIARAIHESSSRSGERFLAVNMAAVPPTLATSELFGAERGAYTGAVTKQAGFFHRAHQGTLFLDEIGETPSDVQPLLLRVLENGEIQPVGAAAPLRVDVRLVAATDADLEARIESGSFREPLLHRLAGYEIRVPTLNERCGDFGRLLYFFLRRELAASGLEPEEAFRLNGRPWPPADLVATMARQPWPGNVRQLENAARRLAIARGGGEIGLDVVGSLYERPPEDGERPAEPGTPAATEPQAIGWRPAYRKPSEIDGDELLQALRDNRFELKATAEALGVSRASLYNLVRDHPQIRRPSEIPRREIEDALTECNDDLSETARALQVSLHGLKLRMKALGLR